MSMGQIDATVPCSFPLQQIVHLLLSLPAEQHLTAALTLPHSAWWKHTTTSSTSNSNSMESEKCNIAHPAGPPLRQHLLVVIGADEPQEGQAAARVAAEGFDR